MSQLFHDTAKELQLKEGNFKIEYRYIREDITGWPIVTCCVLTDVNNNKGVGISICNNLDGCPNKKIGRAIAYGRALKSLISHKNYPLIGRGGAIKGEFSVGVIEENILVTLSYKGMFFPSYSDEQEDNKISSISNGPDLDVT